MDTMDSMDTIDTMDTMDTSSNNTILKRKETQTFHKPVMINDEVIVTNNDTNHCNHSSSK